MAMVRQVLRVVLALTLASACARGRDPARPVVVLFLVDGLQDDAARTAAANGASNIRFVFDNGVSTETAYVTSPAARLILPDGSLPWGNASSGNVEIGRAHV